MGEQARPHPGHGLQLVLDEGFEAPVQRDSWQPGVPRLFEGEQQGFAQSLRRQQRRLPVALVHPPAVEQMDFLDPEEGRCAQTAEQDFGPGQRQQ